MLMYIGQALAGCGLLLAVAVQARFLATAFDHEFTLLATGTALFGAGAGLGLGYWLIPAEARADNALRTAASLLAAALAVAGGLLLLPNWPLGSVPAFIGLMVGFSLPFAAWGFGVARISRDPAGQASRIAWLGGAVVGLLLAGKAVEFLDGLAAAGWVSAALLGIAAMFVAGRNIRLELAGGALLVLAGAVYHIHIDHPLEPAWSGTGLAEARPLYGQLRAGRLATAPVTHWTEGQRTDVLVYPGQGLRWLFTGATTPVPVVSEGHGQDLGRLERQFPLLAVPMRISPPQHLLTVGPVPGPEVDLARARGAEAVHALAYNEWLAGESYPDTVLQVTTDMRGALARGTGDFDQVVLPITHISKRNRVGSNLADRHLYTLEALQAYWQRLKPGGMLVVTAADEVLFTRSILSVWRMLEQSDPEGRAAYARRSWGLRLTSGATVQQPHSYLLLVAKGQVTEDLPARIREGIRGLPVEALFGPGLAAGRPSLGGMFEQSKRKGVNSVVGTLFGPEFLAKDHYAGLYQLEGLDRATEEVRRALSRKAGYWVNIAPTTDARPVFFDLRPGQRPELKWLFTGLLVIIAGVILFALPSRRRAEADLSRRPAMAVYLVYMGLLGAVGGMTLTGLLEQAVRLTGMSIQNQERLLALAVLGVIGTVARVRGRTSGHWQITAPAAGGLLITGLLYWAVFPGYSLLTGWPSDARWLASGCGRPVAGAGSGASRRRSNSAGGSEQRRAAAMGLVDAGQYGAGCHGADPVVGDGVGLAAGRAGSGRWLCRAGHRRVMAMPGLSA
ncbi:hypothetical protein D6C00_05510 [Thiohalobacter thiocyanaticus]|uniref:Uncharacterized protein n=2 Tax=Thiohalobacter thiocyanaticus TaxID=585455 RepID=A0A426QI73_9GAMM|nr:hypothetical protein D6C00_05510 [Thiohalobacter thiocyanaticus]